MLAYLPFTGRFTGHSCIVCLFIDSWILYIATSSLAPIVSANQPRAANQYSICTTRAPPDRYHIEGFLGILLNKLEYGQS